MTTRPVRRRRSSAIFAWPAVIASLTVVGLVIGLTGDGWRDGFAWVFVSGAPIAILIAFKRRQSPKLSQKPETKDNR